MYKAGKLFGAVVITLVVFTFTMVLGPYTAAAAGTAVEVLHYTGNTAVDAANFENDLKTALNAKGVDINQVKYTNAITTTFSATDTFAWTLYDHTGNWGEDTYPNGDQNPAGGSQNKHIIIKNNGKNITFYGYGRPAFKDFMFMQNTVESKKTFTFDLNEANIHYHSMEGGGFLFNSKIVNGTLSGYAILFDQNGMQLYEITGVNAANFHEEQYSQMRSYPGIKLLKTFSKGTSPNHGIKIEVTPEKLDLWDNSNHTIAGYSLPTKYGNGFGPIASHNSHDCNELSYFTFDNLKMSMTLTLSLADVINNAKWGTCSRYIVNLEDGLVPALNDAATKGQILSKLAKDKVNYIGWGTETNKAQALSFIAENSNRGVFADNTNYANSVQEIATYIFAQLKQDLAAAKASLKPGFASGDKTESLTKNLNLPTTGANCTAISWASSDPSLVSNSGAVTRSKDGDKTVTLTATITKAGLSETIQFVVTVKQQEVLVKTGSSFDAITLSIIGLMFVAAGVGTLKTRSIK